MASKRIENGQRMILRGEESFIRIAKGWQKRIAEGQIREILKLICTPTGYRAGEIFLPISPLSSSSPTPLNSLILFIFNLLLYLT